MNQKMHIFWMQYYDEYFPFDEWKITMNSIMTNILAVQISRK